MRISKTWAMPNSNTFSIGPVRDCINRHLNGFSIDPFANTNKIATMTNDINPACEAQYCMDAQDFLRNHFEDGEVDTVLFDPPYSPRQVSECYKSLNKTVNMQTTQSKFWADIKKEIARITANKGIVITCGWNSGGIGKNLGFKQIEILLVAHGGWHNDTIVTVEQKHSMQQFALPEVS